jgi:hypothetical protein
LFPAEAPLHEKVQYQYSELNDLELVVGSAYKILKLGASYLVIAIFDNYCRKI